MRRGIYGPPSYQMGLAADANAPITRDAALRAKAELAAMKSSLVDWLRYRSINDAIAAGRADQVKTPLLKRPGARPPDPARLAGVLRAQRAADEQDLATKLHALLSEVFDAGQLPTPDVAKDPGAAVALAKIAIAGQLPGETATPGAQGFVWLWPLVVVIGTIAFVITSAIRSRADLAKEREKYECIKAGKCTDGGFWLKVGAIGVGAWFLWEKAGVGARVKSAVASAGRRGGRR